MTLNIAAGAPQGKQKAAALLSESFRKVMRGKGAELGPGDKYLLIQCSCGGFSADLLGGAMRMM